MNYNIISRRIYTIGLFLFFAFTIQSCATKYPFSTSSVVPAAEGSVKIKKDKNNNYNIDLSVMRLADSRRLTPPKEMYIVWMETDDNGTKNIGQLNTSKGLLSNTLKSSLKTVSAFKPTGFFITAEDNATTQYPAAEVILRTGSLNKGKD